MVTVGYMSICVVLLFFPSFLGTISLYLCSKWVVVKVGSPVLGEGSRYSVNLCGDLFGLQGCDPVLNLQSGLEYGVS